MELQIRHFYLQFFVFLYWDPKKRKEKKKSG